MEKVIELDWVEILDILKLKIKSTLILLSLFTLLCYIFLSYFNQKTYTASLEIIQTKNVDSLLYDKINNFYTNYVISIDELADSLKSIELNSNIQLLHDEFNNPYIYQNVKQYFNKQSVNNIYEIYEKFKIELFKTDKFYGNDYDLIKISFDNYKNQDLDSFSSEVEIILQKILNDAHKQVLSKKNKQINLVYNKYIKDLDSNINSIEENIEAMEKNYTSKFLLLLNFLNEQYDLAKIIELSGRTEIQMTGREFVVFESNIDVFTLSGLYLIETSDTILKRIKLSEKKDLNYFKQNDVAYYNLIRKLKSLNNVRDNLISISLENSLKLSDEIFKSQNFNIYTEEDNSLNKIFILSIFATFAFFMLNIFTLLSHIYRSKR